MNKMKEIKIEKITLNIGVGGKDNMDNSIKILKELTGLAPKKTICKKRNPFGGAVGKPVGCMVTVRKNKIEFLKRLLTAKENTLKRSSFDANGNFSFGVSEYIDIPGMEYDAKIGMIGLDVSVTLERHGFRVRRRKNASKIGKKHEIRPEDAIQFAEEMGVKVV